MGLLSTVAAAVRGVPVLRTAARTGRQTLHGVRVAGKRARRAFAHGMRRARRGLESAGADLRRATSRRGRRLERQYTRLAAQVARGRGRLHDAFGGFDVSYGPPDERRNCPACAGRRLTHLDTLWHYRKSAPRFVGFATGCRTCGLVFANPFPTRDALDEFYAHESEYFERRSARVDARGRSLVDAPPAPGARVSRDNPRLRALFASIAPDIDIVAPPPAARVLDFGCGPGRMLDRLRALGWETYGIEPAVKSAFERHRELNAPPDEPTFDLITVHHVLEHLAEPLAVLASLARALRDGGFLYISVPRLDRAAEHGDLQYALNSHTHVVSYTERCLQTLVTMAGLTPLATRNDDELDRLLTRGQPRRQRLFARKAATVPPRPANPLGPAREAFRAYYRRHPEEATPGAGMLPVRLRAAWLQHAKDMETARRRAQKGSGTSRSSR